MAIMKRALKILLWTFAGLITFVLVTVMGAILWANSDSGQRKIVSLIEVPAMPRIRATASSSSPP